MSQAKLVVLYPEPTDRVIFEKRYAEEHVPLMADKMKGLKVNVTKLLGTPAGDSPYFYMAEIYAPTLDAIKGFLGTPDGQEVAGHAGEISSGGPPVVIFSDENTHQF